MESRKSRRILLISGFNPSAAASSSGPKIVYEEIERRRKEGETVDVIAFENEMERRHRKAQSVKMDETTANFSLRSPGRLLAAVLMPWLPLAASARPLVARRYVSRMIETGNFDDIIVEFTQAIEVVHRKHWLRVTLVAHDILTQVYERRVSITKGWRRVLYQIELQRLRKWEKSVLANTRKVVALSHKDRELVERMTGRKDVDVRMPIVRPYCSPEERVHGVVDPDAILFWGHMARRENIDAAEYFVKQVLPRVLEKRPSARFIIAGIDPPAAIRALAGPHVSVLGFVADPSTLFRTSGVGVVPLRAGSGIKIKTLEMIASGLPTVATDVGAEGVPNSPLLRVVNEDKQFADALLSEMESLRRGLMTRQAARA